MRFLPSVFPVKQRRSMKENRKTGVKAENLMLSFWFLIVRKVMVWDVFLRKKQKRFNVFVI